MTWAATDGTGASGGNGAVATTDALAQVAELVRRESGLDLPEVRRTALGAAIRRTGAAGPEELLARVEQAGGPALVGRLLDEVTVQETSFLRDAAQLEAIDWQALHAGAVRAAGRAAAPLRIWSAGCATGEEAYSLALLAGEALAGAPVDVLGTDLSAAAVARAEAGRYRARRARNVPASLRSRLLVEDGGTVVVRPELRRLVRFARHNLVADPAPPAGEAPFDIVVCRNVLIYFDAATADDVAAKLRGALRPGGLLVLGFADQLGRGGRASRSASAAAATAEPAPEAPSASTSPPLPLLEQALIHADAGRVTEALARIELLLARDPLNAGGHFLRGLVQLGSDPHAAIASLRRALLIDPRFGLASFQLGRAYEAVGDPAAALAAYDQALFTLDPDDMRYAELLRQVDLGDVATAICARIQVLR